MSSNEDALGGLEKEALKRKDRLKALKRRVETNASSDETPSESDTVNQKYFSTKTILTKPNRIKNRFLVSQATIS